jgi:membrane-associated phosphatidylinositol transfer protein
VFSIDGSFTASVSVTGRDPKVRAGAVDIVRCVKVAVNLTLYLMTQHCCKDIGRSLAT